MRRSPFLIAAIFAGAVQAQTPPVSPPAVRHVTPKHVAHSLGTKAAPHQAHVATPPVLSPRHGRVRKPVHPTTQAAIERPKPATRPVSAKPAIPKDEGTVTHLHLPRYVSLRSDEVNMRSGPGERYPVLWQYKRKDLPVKIEREFDIWRLVEDMDGTKGWVHQATLTGRRTFIVTATDERPLRPTAGDGGQTIALVKPGVVGRILACDAGAPWCRVQIGDYRGFLPRATFWGTDAGEAVAP